MIERSKFYHGLMGLQYRLGPDCGFAPATCRPSLNT